MSYLHPRKLNQSGHQTNRRALLEFLLSNFTDEEFRDWLSLCDMPKNLLNDLPNLSAPSHFFVTVVGLLDRHGVLDTPEFFYDLLAVRPRRAEAIAALAGMFTHDRAATVAHRLADHSPEGGEQALTLVSCDWTQSQRITRLQQLVWHRGSLAFDDPRRIERDAQITALCREIVAAAPHASLSRDGPRLSDLGDPFVIEVIGPRPISPRPDPISPRPDSLSPDTRNSQQDAVKGPLAPVERDRQKAAVLLPALAFPNGAKATYSSPLDATPGLFTWLFRAMATAFTIGGVALAIHESVPRTTLRDDPVVESRSIEAAPSEQRDPDTRDQSGTFSVAAEKRPATRKIKKRGTPAPSSTKQQVPHIERTSTVRPDIPPLQARLGPQIVREHLGDLISWRDHPDFSLRISVRPDGSVDPTKTQTSHVFGELNEKLVNYPFPPSLQGSGELFCHVVKGEDALRCDTP